MDGPRPLARTLTLALRLLVDDLHRRLDEEGFGDLRPAHGYVLNAAAADGGITTSALANVLGMTKQGAAKVVAELEEAGYVDRGAGADGRARPVTLTPRGTRALDAAAGIQHELERGWVALSSPEEVASLRAVLDRVLEAHGADRDPPPLRPAW